MKIIVTYLNNGQKHEFEGEPHQIQAQLHMTFSWLPRYKNDSLKGDLERLAMQQLLTVETET